MKKVATLFLATIFLCGIGCAPKPVVKMWEASGGSRADATVEVGFLYNPETEKPEHSEQQALQEALKRCQAWGYTNAEPFGLYKERCQKQRYAPYVGMICYQMFVSRQYQCLGRGDSSLPTSGNSENRKNHN